MSDSSRLPLATLILIIANLAAAFALVWQPVLIDQFGFVPARPTIESVFAGLFLHANLLHLLGNMLFLAAVGAAVELATGASRFVTVYLASGLAGVGAHYLLAPRLIGDPQPLVGASGCIAGCAAYYGIRYLRLKVPLAPRFGVPIAAVIVAWLGLQIAGAFATIGDPGASTAFWAHLGGFAAGLVASAIYRAPDLGQRRLGHEVLDKMNERGPAAVIAAATRHLQTHPKDLKALQQLVDAHALMNDGEGEAGALARIIDLLPESEIGEPICRLGELRELGRYAPTQRIRLAERVGPHDRKAAVCLLQSVIEEPAGEPQRPEAMLALASLLRTIDIGWSDALLARLSEEFPLHPTVDVARTRGWLR